MAKTKVRVERRKYKRFQVHSGAYASLRPSVTYVGRIIDIGLDGLAFEYVDGEEPSGRPNELEIFVTDSDLHLKGLPCQKIYNLTIYESPFSALSRQRCGVQFGKLTLHQKAQLAYFIEHHAIGGKSLRTKSIFDDQRTDTTHERALQIDKEDKKYLENLINNLPKGCRQPKEGFENICKAEDIGLEGFVKCLAEIPLRCHLSVGFLHSWYCACPLGVYIAKNLKV